MVVLSGSSEADKENRRFLNRVNANRTSSGKKPVTDLGSPNGPQGDPLGDALNAYNNGWQMQGGSSWDNSQAIRDQYQSRRDKSAQRKGETEAELTKLYDNLAASYEPYPEQTKQRYTDARLASEAGSNRLIADTRARMDQEAASQNSAFAELGLGGGGMSSSTSEANRGIGDVQNTSSNWSGLLNAQQNSQVNRDNINIQGSRDQGVLAKDDLVRRYNAYLDQLDAEEQDALNQPGVKGSTAGSMVNTSGIPDSLYNKMLEQQMINAGVLPTKQNSNDADFDLWLRKEQWKRANPTTTGGSTYTPPAGGYPGNWGPTK